MSELLVPRGPRCHVRVFQAAPGRCLRGQILPAEHPEPLRTMRRAGLIDLVGEENVVPDIDIALRRARRILSG